MLPADASNQQLVQVASRVTSRSRDVTVRAHAERLVSECGVIHYYNAKRRSIFGHASSPGRKWCCLIWRVFIYDRSQCYLERFMSQTCTQCVILISFV